MRCLPALELAWICCFSSWFLIKINVFQIITLIGSDVSLELGTAYTDDGATASDNIDDDITASIVTVSTVDENAVGIYKVTYNVSDAAGKTATPVVRNVEITRDVTIPVITLNGLNHISVELGTTYRDDGATASDNINGDITDDIEIPNNADDTIKMPDSIIQDRKSATEATRTNIKSILSNIQAVRILALMAKYNIQATEFKASNLGISKLNGGKIVMLDTSMWDDKE